MRFYISIAIRRTGVTGLREVLADKSQQVTALRAAAERQGRWPFSVSR